MTVRAVILALLPVFATMSMVDAEAGQRGTVRKGSSSKTPPKTAAKTASPARPAAPAATSQTTREAPLMQCPSVLGNGAKTQRLFCDVLVGTHAAGGLRISIPEHQGAATLRFTLHNRQVVADEPAAPVKGAPAAPPVYARYTAALKIVKSDGAVLSEAIVQSEYRSAADLVERIAGGTAPGGVKAVAPTGSEVIVIDVPPDVREVSLLGDQLKVERLGGTELINTPGRPIAVVSQVQVEYRPITSSAQR
jgi:hypothetical protein